MNIVAENSHTVHVDDDHHEPTESDRQWWASQTGEWHDLDHQADDDDIDQRAGEAAYLASHELGLKTF